MIGNETTLHKRPNDAQRHQLYGPKSKTDPTDSLNN